MYLFEKLHCRNNFFLYFEVSILSCCYSKAQALISKKLFCTNDGYHCYLVLNIYSFELKKIIVWCIV